MNFGLFAQMIVGPLLHEHRILTQVAGYHTEVIKFLPSLIVTQQDLDWFLSAMQQVLETLRIPQTAVGTVSALARGAMRSRFG